jgi:hypothetical protein
MGVEGQVGAVDSDIILEGDPNLSMKGARYRLQPLPKQTVMHQQEIHTFVRSFAQYTGRSVDGRSNSCHASGVLDLQSIEGILGVTNLGHTQIFVCVSNYLSQRRLHGITVT